jgi:magnesium-protoporphyrin IX monomethyl ester (oxidative) cyclase
MIWRFNRVYNAERQLHDHHNPVRYGLPAPEHRAVGRRDLYIHPARTKAGTKEVDHGVV